MPTGAYSLADIDQTQGKGKFSLADVEENHTNPAATPMRHFWQPTERERTGDPNAPMQPSIEDQFLSTELSNAWQTIKGLPGGIREAFTAPPTPEEAKQYGLRKPTPNVLEQGALGIGRMIGQPLQNAAEWYAREAQLQDVNKRIGVSTLEKMASASAEGLGQAAGNVIAGKAIPAVGERLARIPKGGTFTASTPLREAITKTGEAIVERATKSSREAAAQELAQQAQAEQAARQKWVDKAYEAKQSQAAAESIVNQREALTRGQEALTERAHENIQQTHEAVRGSLNERSDAMRTRMADVYLEQPPLLESIAKGRQKLAGVPADLKIFDDIVDALEKSDMEATAARVTPEGVAPVEPGGLPFNEARIQATALGEKWSAASGNLRRALKGVYDTYNERLQAAADAAGTGREYKALREDWHQYFEDWQGKGPLAKALQAQHPNYLQPIATGKASPLLSEALARYKGYGAKPEVIAQIRQMGEQASALPKVKVLKPPPPYEAPPVPEAAPLKLSPLPKAAVWIGGKLIGSQVAGLYGTMAGGKIATYAAEKMLNRLPRVPGTSEEYMRQMLAAKEGTISPGELERRLKPGGKATKIRKLTDLP